MKGSEEETQRDHTILQRQQHEVKSGLGWHYRWLQQYQQRTAQELNLAWDARKSATVWGLTRQLTLKGTGPKKRNFRLARLQTFDSSQWQTLAETPAHKGGLSAKLIDVDEVYQTYINEQPPPPPETLRRGVGTSTPALKRERRSREAPDGVQGG